ncbi:ArsA family ATPase, partial [Streptomyces longispororuber]
DALREAAYFVERLGAEKMPLAGLVLNRVHSSGAAQLSAEQALAAAENLDGGGIVDQPPGKAGLVGNSAPEAATDRATSSGPGSPADQDGVRADTAAGAEEEKDTDEEVPVPVEELTAGLLRLHAERMRLLAREQRTRDRFTARHPEVPVAEVPALPGDVHDLAGLRAIGTHLAESGTGPADEA